MWCLQLELNSCTSVREACADEQAYCGYMPFSSAALNLPGVGCFGTQDFLTIRTVNFFECLLLWERSQQYLQVSMLMDLLLIELVKSSSEPPVQSGYLLFCLLFLPYSVSEMLHTGHVLAECWILNCGPVHLNMQLNLSWNEFVILEMKPSHSKGGENIRAALATW